MRGKLACAYAEEIRRRRLTIGINDNSLHIFTAPTVVTLVRRTTVYAITPCLPRKAAAINNRVTSSRLGPATRKHAIGTATRLITIRKEGLGFTISTDSSRKLVNRNRRLHFVISQRGFVTHLKWPVNCLLNYLEGVLCLYGVPLRGRRITTAINGRAT